MSRYDPLGPDGGTVIFTGNLTPDGCVIKRTAADPALLRHTGPAVVFEDGDEIALDVPGRSLTLAVGEDELARRRAAWSPRRIVPARGYVSMYAQHVTQADRGCDFDFLHAGAPIGEPEIF